MFDVWAAIVKLGQPCLYKRLNHHLIGNDGLVRNEVLTGIDRIMCENLLSLHRTFEAPTDIQRISAEQRFLNVSALQKSIRRGDAAGAMRFAQQGCQIDQEHVFRRLAVCAVEDVGIGNLAAVGMALALMGNKQLRNLGPRGSLAALIARELAASAKSRLACDLISIVDYDRSLGSMKEQLVNAPVHELRHLAENKAAPIAHRMLSAWLLAGTRRFAGTDMPITPKRPRTEFMQMMAASRAPLLLHYIADRTAARLAEAMFVASHFIAEFVADEPDIELQTRHLTPSAEIEGFPAASYDLHTREGRFALNHFGRECGEISSLLVRLPTSMRELAIRHGVFIVEGGLLQSGLRFDAANTIETDAHGAEMAFAGLNSETSQSAFLKAISDNLSLLDDLRRRPYFRSI
jgi:hypothetical protein